MYRIHKAKQQLKSRKIMRDNQLHSLKSVDSSPELKKNTYHRDKKLIAANIIQVIIL